MTIISEKKFYGKAYPRTKIAPGGNQKLSRNFCNVSTLIITKIGEIKNGERSSREEKYKHN